MSVCQTTTDDQPLRKNYFTRFQFRIFCCTQCLNGSASGVVRWMLLLLVYYILDIKMVNTYLQSVVTVPLKKERVSDHSGTWILLTHVIEPVIGRDLSCSSLSCAAVHRSNYFDHKSKQEATLATNCCSRFD